MRRIIRRVAQPPAKAGVSLSLTDQIRVAITSGNIQEMYRLKDICDIIHSTGNEYQNYTPNDLPSDPVYQLLEKKINELASRTRVAPVVGTSKELPPVPQAQVLDEPRRINRQRKVTGQTTLTNESTETRISDMWMSSVNKREDVPDIPDAILTPKYDGCSCGVRLVRVNKQFGVKEALTRGRDVGATSQRTNLTGKFMSIAKPLTALLESPEKQSLQFTTPSGTSFSFADVTEITIRGEIVLKERVDGAPAAIVAGKINGGQEVWNEFIGQLTFKPFEVMRMYTPTEVYTPTQIESVQLLDMICLRTTLTSDSMDGIQAYYEELKEQISEPIDGVVYSACDWHYPEYDSETLPSAYGKWAWKPTSEGVSILRNVEYTITRDGKISFVFEFDRTQINGKNYLHAKVAVSRLLNELSGMGFGSTIGVKISRDVMPYIDSFVPDDKIEPFPLPKECPWCHQPLTLKGGKTPTLTCTNLLCQGVLSQKFLNLLKCLHVKGVAERKLATLNPLNMSNLQRTYVRNISEYLHATTTEQFLIGIGIGGAQKVQKLIQQTDLNGSLPAYEAFQSAFGAPIVEFLQPYLSDPFIEDVVNFFAEELN